MCLSKQQISQIDKVNSFMTQILLDPKDTATLSPLLFISIRLKQYGLRDSYDEIDILIETYTRAIDRIRKDDNYEIVNLSAWFKRVSNNIICDICKIRGNFEKVSKDIGLKYQSFEDIDPRVEIITKAFSCLDEEDRELLNLRIVRGLSWSDIVAKFVSEGRKDNEGNLFENTDKYCLLLRKRFSRAKIKLRKKYDLLEE